MKFINLKPLNINRLKAYRTMLEARIGGYEHCWCGDGCSWTREQNEKDPNYINLRTCLDRVNKELARKQALLRHDNPAHVPTVREEQMLRGKVRHWRWTDEKKAAATRRKLARQAEAKTEEARGPGRTIVFHFEQKGFNAHVADGKFTYDTPEGAKKAAESMRKQPGFTKVEIV